MCNSSEAIYERGIEQGMEQGREQYSRQMAKLGPFLLKESRMDELNLVMKDPSKLEELIKKYNL